MEHDGQGPHFTWTHAKVQALRAAYKQAVQEGEQEIVFEGREIVMSYAKYLLEYLEGHFGKE